MGFLSASELSEIRGAVALGLPQTATINRLTRYNDGRGGQVEEWAETGTAACRLTRGGKTSDATKGDAQTSFANHRVEIDATSDIRTTDRLVIDGQTFVVIGPVVREGYDFKRIVDVELL